MGEPGATTGLLGTHTLIWGCQRQQAALTGPPGGCGGTGLPKGPEVSVQIWHGQTRREGPGSAHPRRR